MSVYQKSSVTNRWASNIYIVYIIMYVYIYIYTYIIGIVKIRDKYENINFTSLLKCTYQPTYRSILFVWEGFSRKMFLESL